MVDRCPDLFMPLNFLGKVWRGIVSMCEASSHTSGAYGLGSVSWWD